MGRRQGILQQAIGLDPISFAVPPRSPEEEEDEKKELLCWLINVGTQCTLHIVFLLQRSVRYQYSRARQKPHSHHSITHRLQHRSTIMTIQSLKTWVPSVQQGLESHIVSITKQQKSACTERSHNIKLQQTIFGNMQITDNPHTYSMEIATSSCNINMGTIFTTH